MLLQSIRDYFEEFPTHYEDIISAKTIEHFNQIVANLPFELDPDLGEFLIYYSQIKFTETERSDSRPLRAVMLPCGQTHKL